MFKDSLKIRYFPPHTFLLLNKNVFFKGFGFPYFYYIIHLPARSWRTHKWLLYLPLLAPFPYFEDTYSYLLKLNPEYTGIINHIMQPRKGGSAWAFRGFSWSIPSLKPKLGYMSIHGRILTYCQWVVKLYHLFLCLSKAIFTDITTLPPAWFVIFSSSDTAGNSLINIHPYHKENRVIN